MEVPLLSTVKTPSGSEKNQNDLFKYRKNNSIKRR
jgi:hypothetical protein